MTNPSTKLNMRAEFARLVYLKMQKNKKIWLVVGDLGYRMWDNIKKDFPDRFINVGASEQAMIGVGIGLALEGKIPIVYSITPFLLYRPFETIRNYLNHEKIPVKLVGSGRDKDYSHDGISHWALEDKKVLEIFGSIKAFWPETAEELPALVSQMFKDKNPWYVNLRR